MFYDIEQNTPEWEILKLGKFSASPANDLMMKETNEGYKNLIKRIVEERITGLPSESKWKGNKYTERGHEWEPIAREHFELETFTKVLNGGFFESDEYKGWASCSPDGRIGNDGLIQIKNPIFSTQLDYLDDKKIPSNYIKQMQFELFITGREWNIFYSYHPSLPPINQKLYRDEKMISEIKTKLEIAIEQVNNIINKIKAV